MALKSKATVLLAGPTASGKSALALQLARTRGGIVINADSMQVYGELSVLTARPSPADETAAPHRLYGHVAAAEAYSVARWLEDVAAVVAQVREAGAVAIIVGGTGLYFKALTEGLSAVPRVPDEVRRRWRQLATQAPPGELHRILAGRDPVMAARLAPGDTQRLTRALEVMEATGRSLAEWQALPGVPLVRAEVADCLVVRRPRSELHDRCDRRLDAMIEAGALDEVARLVELELPDDAPVMRALGVRPLAAHLVGRLSRDQAVAQAKLETRQYVKRQETWLNRNMSSWKIV
ncbi:MAG: tRNA (adenosine(37)-N6)-dimethylallyltransferase MiaA [Hyphomicrobiaceae bacterium]|nr:tRNA (adenosine(37)-N6)-dimethylallyltransferase MiaA [Hyphomicrobiaceae bacterium]